MRQAPQEYAVLLTVVFLVSVLWVAEPLFARYAIDTLMTLRDGAGVNLPWIFGWWGALFLALSASQTLEKYLTWGTQNRTELQRSAELYRHVLHLDIAFHTGQKSGEVVKLIDEGAENLAELQRNLIVDFLPSLLASSAFLVIGFAIQPLLAGILCVLIAVYIGIVIIGSMRTMRLQQQANRAWVARIGRAYDAALNIFSVKSGAQEERELGTFLGMNDRVLRAQLAVNRRWAAVEAINFFMLTRVLLAALGILLFVRGGLSLGELFFFQSSFFRVLTPFEILSNLLPFWNKKIGKVRLSEDLLQTPVRVRNAPRPVIRATVQGRLELQGVCFTYAEKVRTFETDTAGEKPQEAPPPDPTDAAEQQQPHPPEPRHPRAEEGGEAGRGEGAIPETERHEDAHDGREVLHDITLDIPAGEHVAFVGHSGAGKTTIAMLLNRFYDVTHGRILLDGTDVRGLDLQWWRGQVGLVLQENIMFNDTIEENIRYARPDATDGEVREAAGRAAAADFIQALPNGYGTLIGERGIRLSGGQRQRIAIARAILKNPTVVILDEATSALDSVTERKVQEGIRELITGRTAVIIAHRLSTVRSVDRIAVLDKGKLIAMAPHAELLKTCEIYREMVELQSQGMLAE